MTPKNIKYVLTLLAIFAITSYGLDKVAYFAIRKIANKVYSGQSVGKLNQYLEIKDSVDVLIFGSSRANHNINPSRLANSGFNMGVDGQKIAFSATLTKLLSPNKKQTLLFHIDPTNALDPDYKADDLGSLSVIYNENSVVKTQVDKFQHNNNFQFFYWCLAYNGKLLGIVKNYLKPSYAHQNYNGYDPIRTNENQRRIFKKMAESKISNVIEDCRNKPFELNSIYKNYLKELKDFSRRNNKTLIIFTSPVFLDSCKTDNAFFKKEMIKMGLVYFDFTNLYDRKIIYEDWKDFVHLSVSGAEKFTDTIRKNVLEQ